MRGALLVAITVINNSSNSSERVFSARLSSRSHGWGRSRRRAGLDPKLALPAVAADLVGASPDAAELEIAKRRGSSPPRGGADWAIAGPRETGHPGCNPFPSFGDSRGCRRPRRWFPASPAPLRGVGARAFPGQKVWDPERFGARRSPSAPTRPWTEEEQKPRDIGKGEVGTPERQGRVLVGAPKADSKYSTSVKSPGAVFKCRVHTNPDRRCTELDMARGKSRGTPCGKTCREDRDDEWMGVSLARQPKADGRVLACAHRWKNIYYETDHILPHGFCYIIPSNLQAKGRTLIPCYEEYKKKYGEEHGSCQAGIAGFFMEELVVMGAPGSFYWAGTVKVLNLTDNTYFKLNDEAIMNRRYTYLGYAVTAGHFSHSSTTDVVGGAPQDEGIGKVYIFRADRRSGTLIKIFQASGKKMGSYFGSSLCAVDLNRDGLSDLLVGAPMFSEIRDEGQVTVYINRGNGALEEQLALTGDCAYNAHFGESIASLDDLDDDGFPDVAIGAPKEDDFAGAVYIYHGDASGIVPQYSMKLSGRKINPVLRMFGQSISGGIDMDGNGYPDVTVGAFMSDSVVLLRARPVITLDVSIFLPGSINITAPQCHDGQQAVNCLNITACFRFHGKHVPGEIGLNYVLTADVAKKEKGQLPRVYFVLLGETAGQVSEKLQLTHMEEMCRHYVAHVKDGMPRRSGAGIIHVSDQRQAGYFLSSSPEGESQLAAKLGVAANHFATTSFRLLPP
ncbi:integrin alpha-9, partial [Carlito syrichta]|uniref:Integrin alpha-9 n=1 Tax=Carlito syrichta TaxID=1868482 RepID=A0A1U7TSR8_CARSF